MDPQLAQMMGIAAGPSSPDRRHSVMHQLRTEFRDGCKLTVVQGETFDAIHDANQVMDLTEFCEWVRHVGLLPEFVSVAEAKRVFCEVNVGEDADETRGKLCLAEFLYGAHRLVDAAASAAGRSGLPTELAEMKTALEAHHHAAASAAPAAAGLSKQGGSPAGSSLPSLEDLAMLEGCYETPTVDPATFISRPESASRPAAFDVDVDDEITIKPRVRRKSLGCVPRSFETTPEGRSKTPTRTPLANVAAPDPNKPQTQRAKTPTKTPKATAAGKPAVKVVASRFMKPKASHGPQTARAASTTATPKTRTNSKPVHGTPRTARAAPTTTPAASRRSKSPAKARAPLHTPKHTPAQTPKTAASSAAKPGARQGALTSRRPSSTPQATPDLGAKTTRGGGGGGERSKASTGPTSTPRISTTAATTGGASLKQQLEMEWTRQVQWRYAQARSEQVLASQRGKAEHSLFTATEEISKMEQEVATLAMYQARKEYLVILDQSLQGQMDALTPVEREMEHFERS